jgi:hypothetical protein
MERIVERQGALDVHKESVAACVRVWGGRQLVEHMANFRTTVQGLLGLRDWLEALGMRQVAMEATGEHAGSVVPETSASSMSRPDLPKMSGDASQLLTPSTP